MMRGSKLDEIMTLLFMLMAIAAVIGFFAFKSSGVFYACAGAAVVLRIIQYLLRFFK